MLIGGLSSEGRDQQQRYDMVGQKASVKACLSEGDFSTDIAAEIKSMYGRVDCVVCSNYIAEHLKSYISIKTCVYNNFQKINCVYMDGFI